MEIRGCQRHQVLDLRGYIRQRSYSNQIFLEFFAILVIFIAINCHHPLSCQLFEPPNGQIVNIAYCLVFVYMGPQNRRRIVSLQWKNGVKNAIVIFRYEWASEFRGSYNRICFALGFWSPIMERARILIMVGPQVWWCYEVVVL